MKVALFFAILFASCTTPSLITPRIKALESMSDIYRPNSYLATVVDVYDGDSYTLMVDLGLGLWTQQKNRMAEIDTPELRGEDRKKGKAARDYVRKLILGKTVIVETDQDKKGKYGRLLTWVYFQDHEKKWVDLGQHLIKRGYAEKY